MGFDNMTVTLQSPRVDYVSEYAPRYVEETVTVPETRVQRFVRLFTRKDVPTVQETHEIPSWDRVPVHHFHTVEFDDSHDAEDVRKILDRLTDRYDYEIVSAVVDVDYSTYETVNDFNSAPTGDQVGTLLVALTDAQEYRHTGLIAAVGEYGYDTDLTSEWMDDHYNGSWNSAAEYVENLVEDCYDIKIPDFVSIDWDDTADNLTTDYDFVDDAENGMVHVFNRY